MRRPRQRSASRRSAVGGFTLFEALVAVALTAMLLMMLQTVTGQWLPNWNRGFARVQRTDLLGLGLERIVADLSAAQYVTPYSGTKKPFFEGSELSVMFVRSALGPNAGPGLELVRLAETSDEHGFALIRERAPFTILAPGAGQADLPRFSDPVVLVRAPFRVRFSYAGEDRAWRDAWHGAGRLPTAIRVSMRNAATDQPLDVSTVAVMRIGMPAQCAVAQSAHDCIANLDRQESPKQKREPEL